MLPSCQISLLQLKIFPKVSQPTVFLSTEVCAETFPLTVVLQARKHILPVRSQVVLAQEPWGLLPPLASQSNQNLGGGQSLLLSLAPVKRSTELRLLSSHSTCLWWSLSGKNHVPASLCSIPRVAPIAPPCAEPPHPCRCAQRLSAALFPAPQKFPRV